MALFMFSVADARWEPIALSAISNLVFTVRPIHRKALMICWTHFMPSASRRGDVSSLMACCTLLPYWISLHMLGNSWRRFWCGVVESNEKVRAVFFSLTGDRFGLRDLEHSSSPN